MCRIYGFRSNEPTKVECTLVHAQNALLLQSQNDQVGRSHPDGWGIATFDGQTPHLEKNSAAAFEGLHFSNTAERVYSKTVVSHVRLATVGKPSLENCHPFRWGNWVFAHNGTVTGIETLRDELTNEISRSLRREICGSTDSELLFYWLIQRAIDRQSIDCQECQSMDGFTRVIVDSIAELDRRCHQMSPDKPAKLNTILTDGKVMIASRLRNSLCIVHRDGIRDCEICGIPHVDHHEGTPYFAVVLASEPLSHETWTPIPDAHVVSVNEALVTELSEIPIEGICHRGHSLANLHQSRNANDQLTADRIAQRILHQKPSLRLDPLFENLCCTSIDERSSFHVDDFSEIPNIARSQRTYYQERARLRAKTGDILATAMPPISGYESYCQQSLGLGAVHWVCPETQSDPIHLAEACWQDREVRRDLVHAIRRKDLRYIHPHMGSQAVWELALLLHQASHVPIQVIAPPPGVTAFANDKGEFTRLTRLLLGAAATPPGHLVWNIAMASKQLQAIAQTNVKTIALKLPNSAGGEGNLVLQMTELKDLSLMEIDDFLHRRSPTIHYDDTGELLVTVWASDVLSSPSAQLWIPPIGRGDPWIDGLFIQMIHGQTGNFLGFRMADLPEPLNRRIVRQCLLLARVYQRLGYVGRCSFDMILVGQDVENCDVQFIECNGRWGGTSLPIALMQQVMGDWKRRPFTSQKMRVPGIGKVAFDAVCLALDDALYQHRTDSGRYLIYNPQRMIAGDEVSLIALMDAWDVEGDQFQRAKEVFENLVGNGENPCAGKNGSKNGTKNAPPEYLGRQH